ncbi:B-type flagellin [Shewanella putrefaciens]|uniref:flagellin N-terminal helical domain-containing protein n=1 Tax=Shewanella putrefaciens TaxID=24 RepID=UPI000E024552|nr:flagellin [Shewanella putrefaciens]SUI89326.1 B-type flagellin [Shewanella putrefaciens]
MAISVNTNVTSMRAQNQLNGANSKLSTSMERLSSGLRINSAKDDAAGLQISNRLTSQVNGISVATRNANDGISMAQTAEGAMQESTNILQRMRDLSLQSANGSNSPEDRASMQKEVKALQDELTRISETTSFGNQKLLDGSFGTKSFQVGANANETISVKLGNTSAASLGNNEYKTAGTVAGKFVGAATNGIGAKVAGDNFKISSASGSTSSITYGANSSSKTIADAINTATGTAGVGVKASVENEVTLSAFTAASNGSTLNLTLNGSAVSVSNFNGNDLSTLANSINAAQIAGVTAKVDENDSSKLVLSSGDDISFAVSDSDAGNASFTATNQDGATSAVTEGGAAVIAVGKVNLDSTEAFSFAGAGTDVLSTALGNSSIDSIQNISLMTQDSSQSALSVIDAAIASIDSQRADLGAVQNRMNFTINNLNNIQSNVSDARSRIQDVDFASETAQLTKQQILSQTSSAMLAQANQLPQTALSLL